ncbi:DUF6734 family protein [Flavobacterium aquicola]|uniref:DUF6734 domain-containing protein n=1 Tax=Flavobacterium aquicola TaxID=1682742 RepID=A0A3E0EP18_9FLAO|nr:DUF6734 family protein [Flavobacterium aquicola]REG99099.1 hypothetical protein C8P67_105269 [Flavobacterium aquicola]
MKEEPRIIYSLDVLPIINNRWNAGNKLKETIYMSALSILYSHLWYKDIEFYVDEIAYKYLYMLPCRVTKVPNNDDLELWMKSKIHAINKQIKPFVHLDTDIFIKKKIHFNFNKVIVERSDDEYYGHYKNQLPFFNQYTQHLDYWHEDVGNCFNCGILGFNDLEIRNQFVNAYYELEAIYIKNRESYLPYKRQGYEPCVVIEQYMLASFLKHKGVIPNLLLYQQNMIDQSNHADKIGYSHIYGKKKYTKNIVGAIEERLSKIFPYWYEQIKTAVEKENMS